MASSGAPAGLLAETLERTGRLTGPMANGPSIGEVYALEATRDFPVYWVLVARDPSDPSLFLALLADGNFLVGSGDVAVAEEASVGRLRIRCRFGAWIEGTDLDLEGRVGTLKADVTSRACRKWLELGSGDVVGTVLEREVDEESGYRNWVEDVLRPAHRTLRELGRKTGRVESAGVVAASKPGRWASLLPWAAAAAILIAVGGGIAGVQVWRQHLRIQDLQASGESLEKRYREEVRQLEAERARVEEEYRQVLEAGEERDEEARSLRERIVELDRRLEEMVKSSSVVNPVVAYLDPPEVTTRGSVDIKIQTGSSHVILFLPLRQDLPASKYRLELRHRARNSLIWMNDQLTLEEPSEIRAGVPVEVLSTGEYKVMLFAWAEGEFRRISEYELRVIHE